MAAANPGDLRSRGATPPSRPSRNCSRTRTLTSIVLPPRPSGRSIAGQKTAVPLLLRLLKDEDSYVRLAAASALGEFGPAAKGGRPSPYRIA